MSFLVLFIGSLDSHLLIVDISFFVIIVI